MPMANRSALQVAGDAPSRLLRYHDGHLLCRCSSPAVLSNHDNSMLSGQQRLGKMVKRSIPCDVRHRLSVDDQRGARLGAAGDFNRVAHELRTLNLEEHILRLALRDQREFIRFAYVARRFPGARRGYVPEVVPGI